MKRHFNFNGIGSKVFHTLRPLGCSAVRSVSPERVHCGHGEDAWSPPALVVYGIDRETAAPLITSVGWIGAVDYR